MTSRQTRRYEKQRNKGEQPPTKKQAKTKTTLWQWLKLLSPTGKLVAGVCAFLTIFAAYCPFYPKITVSSSYSLDPSTPLSTKLDVSNDSLMSIKNVKLICRNIKVKSEGGGMLKSEGTGALKTPQPPIPILSSGETTSFVMPLIFTSFTSPVESADVTIIITYEHLLLPFKREKFTRIVTEKDIYGKLHWTRKSTSEP